MSKFSYFECTNKFSDIAIIESVQKDEKGFYITLDHTIFYPQGGGQPSDQGRLEVNGIHIPILFVKVVNDEIRHYTDQNYDQVKWQKGCCFVNQERRLQHAKLHTAGHLLSHVVESIYSNYKAIKGHHFPNECYVEFISKNGDCEAIDLNLVNRNMTIAIHEKQAIETVFIDKDQLSEMCPDIADDINRTESIRLVRIGSFPYQPCGGTHIHTTSELRGLAVSKFKISKKIIKISYAIEVQDGQV